MKKYLLVISIVLIAIANHPCFAQSENHEGFQGIEKDMGLKEQLSRIGSQKNDPGIKTDPLNSAIPEDPEIHSQSHAGKNSLIKSDASKNQAAPKLLTVESILNDRSEVKTDQKKPIAPESVSQQVGATQPEGEKPIKVIDYSKMNGTNTQPQGEKPLKVTHSKSVNEGSQQPQK